MAVVYYVSRNLFMFLKLNLSDSPSSGVNFLRLAWFWVGKQWKGCPLWIGVA